MTMGTQPPRIAVVGSFNTDLVATVPRRPHKGETLIGTTFGTFNGGKGSNQAVAAARAGATVRMVGRLGQDAFGDAIVATLAAEGVHLEHVVRDAQEGTGVAMIMVDAEGDNSIVIIQRANMRLSRADVEAAQHSIAAAGALLLQLEVPEEASERAAELACAAGVPVLLNPAPARPLSERFLRLVDVLTPNATEAALLTGLAVETDRGAAEAGHALLARGVGAVVITLGERGALLVGPAGVQRYPGYTVQVVDTTAAGDSFCASLGVGLAAGLELGPAIQRANAAGALACTRPGAGPATPYAAEIDALLAKAPGE